MGSLEQGSRSRMRRNQFEHAILSALTVAGIGLVAVAAPNMLKLLKHADPDWLVKRDPKQRLREVAHRLKKKGLVSFERQNGRVQMHITEKGRRSMDRAFMERELIGRKKWDGKWRIVIFDIPEKKKNLRQVARNQLRTFGFHHLQHSVWVYPYDCEELITLLKTELGLGARLLYIIADAIEYDAPLKSVFGLK